MYANNNNINIAPTNMTITVVIQPGGINLQLYNIVLMFTILNLQYHDIIIYTVSLIVILL